MERERHSHESFGQIEFSRRNGNATFYGSELPQENYIMMTLSNSEIERDLVCDRYYPTKRLVEVRMSSAQFSELITSMNIGSGVPCTIERLPSGQVAKLPEIESRKDIVHRNFQDRMKMFADTIRTQQKEAKELVKKKSLSKEDMRTLQNHLDWLTNEVELNIPFFAETFQETMDEVVFEAKLEVENAIQHKINVLGLNALKEENNAEKLIQ